MQASFGTDESQLRGEASAHGTPGVLYWVSQGAEKAAALILGSTS